MLLFYALLVIQINNAYAFVGDEFDGGELSNIWTVYDPVGDVAIEIINNQLKFMIPSGTSHDMWRGAANTAPRVYQQVPNEDFIVQVNFDENLLPVLGEPYRMQGIFVQNSINKFLRFGSYADSNPSESVIFGSSIDSSTSANFLQERRSEGIPNKFRLSRFGDTYTYSTATASSDEFIDHVIYQSDIVVTGIGFYAGNAGSNPPAFEAAVNSFQILYPTPAPTFAPTFTPTFTPTSIPTGIPTNPSFSSDDFNELDTSLWNIFDLVGDVDFVVDDGALTFIIPGGVQHDMWKGVSTAPRIYQEILNGAEFSEILVQWSSPPPTLRYQMHGIFIHDFAQPDASHFLRFGFHSDGNNNILFAAEINGANANVLLSSVIAQAPNRQKIIKDGSIYTYLTALPNEDTFTAHASFDLASFPVNGVGIYAGNAVGSNSPAYNATADYFYIK